MNTRDFLSNMMRFSIPTIVSSLIGVFILPLVSRVYPEAEYGYISNYYSIGNLMMGIVTLGLDQAYIRFFNEPPDNTNRNGLFWFSMSVGIIVSIILFSVLNIIGKGEITEYLFNDQSYVVIITLFLYIISLVVYRLLSINLRFSNRAGEYNLMQVCFILGNRLLFVAAALFSTKYIYSACVMLLSTIIVDVYGYIRQKSELCGGALITKKARIEMLRFAIPVMPVAAIILLNNSIAKLVLGGFGFRKEVGVFAIATSAANVFSIVPNAFAVYWGAFMYQHYNEEQERIKRIHNMIMLLSIFLIIGIILCQDILYLFLGVNYRSSKPYFMMIMLSPISMLLLETTGYGINIAKKTGYSFVISVAGALINYIVCKLSIPSIGAYGAAAGVFISSCFSYIARTVISQHFYKSITSWIQTILSSLLIFALCIGNIVLNSNWKCRVIVIIAVLLCIAVLYRNEICLVTSYINNRTTKTDRGDML